ncbi:SDR family oxidoreductase [Ciceribacter sp. L1K23]|uniref:SDR family oxidoreductase n=1 Tax=Ciceribacter sp. L1K23 TaxID=2820276 RepID=UPI001B83C113|nr:SDR family NAD(P)-dependent oxidoreductase [Ciceribacter sp. L1K23]MBR0557942.1 SDR family oxidoreductase [Ciceribacter sp. L1K23]
MAKVALVTGGASGIGKASAFALSKAGYAVAILGRTDSENQRAVAEIKAAGGDAMALRADISDEDQMRRALNDLEERFGRLDVVVASGGINGVWAPIDDLKPDEWDKTIAVNLRGTFLTVHLTVPLLKRQGGSIIVISSINGTRTFTSPGATAYSATKAAQVAMVQQLALELGRHRIRINAVCPGAVETDIDDNTSRRHEDQTAIPVEWPEGDIPLTDGVPAEAEDVGEVVAFLASDASRHVTGSPIWVDGGQGLLR